ncbi:LANO_0E02938g1_1 [Lachancea nothofagi CBS 11611]|uniref:LANO_0E02938g1_1 n=1 Tax=Lachancea nothofagi CBS 11611 TaxID=1266666 RepID=A0A1G4JQN2_9SACH|nr:LANO_0E02938g1_1 [Lachancea nothofagi CBS 11611]
MTDSPKCQNLQQILDRNPDFTNDTPLDQFFSAFNSQFISKITDDSNAPLYAEVGFCNNSDFVTSLLEWLDQLKDILLEIPTDNESANLVPISLHDMKYFDLLINLIVVHGFYANLPSGIGIPLNQRRIENFRLVDKRFEIPKAHKANHDTLSRASDAFYTTLMSAPLRKNVVGSLLLKGAGFTDLLTALIVLHFEKREDQQRYSVMFQNAESLQETYQLFSLYTLLVHTTKNPQYREFVLSKLSTLPVRRNNGVISLIDFVVGVREDAEIDTSRYNRVSQILVSKPRSLSSPDYFSKLFDQICDGLIFINKPILVSCLNILVTEFYFKNKRIVQDFLFRKINKVLYNEPRQEHSSKELNNTINVLVSLSKNPSVNLTKSLTTSGSNNFYLTLWIYCMFLKKNQRLQPQSDSKNSAAPYYTVVLSLLKTYIVINSDYSALNVIIMNLVNFDHETWGYGINLENQLPYVRLIDQRSIDEEPNPLHIGNDEKLRKVQQVFLDIDHAVELFVELLKALNEPDVVKDIFLSVMNRWVNSTTKSNQSGESMFAEDFQNSLLVLVDLKLMEKLDDTFKNDIIRKPKDVLKMIDELFELPEDNEDAAGYHEDSDDDEDEDDKVGEEDELLQNPRATSVYLTLLKLLSSILSTTPSRELKLCRDVLESILRSLHLRKEDTQSQSLATKIQDLLKSSETSALGGQFAQDYNELDADNEFLQKAMVNINDALAPIRAHGLYELRQLIERKSPVIDLNYVLELHAQQLRDKEPFVYLNAIKGLTALCELEPDRTVLFLLGLYGGKDPQSRNKLSLDDELKVGEVLANYVKPQSLMFGGANARLIVAACVTKVRQHETLDNRARMSAMSLLGVCLETNALGIRKELSDILDCAVNILRLEKSRNASDDSEDSSQLLRRSALHLLHALLAHSGLELLPANYSAAQLTSLLNYVRSTDADYLVYEQAGALLQEIHALQNHTVVPPSTAQLGI